MASNADLISAAMTLGEKLGEDVETIGLKNAELVTLVAGLRARADVAATVIGAVEVTAGLVAQVKALAEALGAPPVETEGISDEDLRGMIANLKVSVDEAAKAVATDDEVTAAAEGAAENEAAKSQTKRDAEADAKKAADAKAVADKKAKQEKPPFYLLPGKAITSKRGILGPGEAVTADDLSGGQETLDARIKSGHIGRG